MGSVEHTTVMSKEREKIFIYFLAMGRWRVRNMSYSAVVAEAFSSFKDGQCASEAMIIRQRISKPSNNNPHSNRGRSAEAYTEERGSPFTSLSPSCETGSAREFAKAETSTATSHTQTIARDT